MGYKAAWRSPASARSAPHLSLVVEGGTSRAVAGQACGMDRNCPLAQPLGQVSLPLRSFRTLTLQVVRPRG